jgi:SAM-dependent methyltransferase
MSTPAAAAHGRTPLDDATIGALLTKAAARHTAPVRLVGTGLHDLAARLIADGVPVEASVPHRRDARTLRRAAQRAGGSVPAPGVGEIDVDLPFPDASLHVAVCRLDPKTFAFPRHTVRELGRALAPDSVVVVLPGGRTSWPASLVDAWAAAAGLVPPDERETGGALPFTGAVYRPRT